MQKPCYVLHAMQRAGIGQAGPLDAALAVCDEVPDTDGLGVVLGWLRRGNALVLLARLRVQQGNQFPVAASALVLASVASSMAAMDSTPTHSGRSPASTDSRPA